MNRLCQFLFFGFTFLLSFSQEALAQKEIPELWGQRVHDEAKALSQQTIDGLEQTLKVFEDSTTNQIAILIVPSLDGEVIEQYALRVAEKWKLGQKDRDNGAVLVIAIEDRKMRIEVGQGLEGPLPDALCNRIIRNEMAPYFRRGDYDAGVIAAVDAIKKAIRGEYKSDGPISRGGKGRSPLTGFFIFLIILIIIIRNSRGNRGGGKGWTSGAGWFIVGSALGRGMGGGGGGGSSWGGGGGSFGGGGSSGSW